MSQLTAIQKANKILGCYDEMEPRKLQVQPHKKSKEKQPSKDLSFSSASKTSSQVKRDFSFCKSRKEEPSLSINSSQSSLPRRQTNSSFVSTYAKQTRYDKIMKLKVKPAYQEGRRDDRAKKSVLDHSFSSSGTARENSKENHRANRTNRLDRIMQIKVSKPKVNSTLTHYEPRQGSKSAPKEKRDSVVKEWKECQSKLRKTREQEEKEERLWRVFERERELRCKLRKEAEEREYKEKRRKEQRFESMVNKELSKIEREREVVKRKSEGFANYIYPAY